MCDLSMYRAQALKQLFSLEVSEKNIYLTKSEKIASITASCSVPESISFASISALEISSGSEHPSSSLLVSASIVL